MLMELLEIKLQQRVVGSVQRERKKKKKRKEKNTSQ